MTHKKFNPPANPMYVPLQVGSSTHEKLGYLCDDTGDNISDLNCYYSELTGVYWVWKNVHDVDYVGVCHYRRYLLNDQDQLLSETEISDILSKYDLITTKKLTLNFSYEYGFQENHTVQDLEAANAAIAKLYPDFYPLYRDLLSQNHTYFGNMMICSKALYDQYCSFLFPIFQEMATHLDLDAYDDYHKRLYGFISEFIWMVWVEYMGLTAYECKVGLVGEKKETTEVVNRMFDLLAQEQIDEAKEYFLAMRQVRPDLLMEASDIHNHLHLCLQAISTAEFELANYGTIRLPLKSLTGLDLMNYLANINNLMVGLLAGQGQMDRISKLDCSDTALDISLKLYAKSPAEYEKAKAKLRLGS